jgi:hypothetical protein
VELEGVFVECALYTPIHSGNGAINKPSKSKHDHQYRNFASANPQYLHTGVRIGVKRFDVQGVEVSKADASNFTWMVARNRLQ